MWALFILIVTSTGSANLTGDFLSNPDRLHDGAAEDSEPIARPLACSGCLSRVLSIDRDGSMQSPGNRERWQTF